MTFDWTKFPGLHVTAISATSASAEVAQVAAVHPERGDPGWHPHRDTNATVGVSKPPPRATHVGTLGVGSGFEAVLAVAAIASFPIYRRLRRALLRFR